MASTLGKGNGAAIFSSEHVNAETVGYVSCNDNNSAQFIGPVSKCSNRTKVKLQVYPNPLVKEPLKIEANKKLVLINMKNTSGKLLCQYVKMATYSAGLNEIKRLNSGVYTLHVQVQGEGKSY